MTLRTTLFTGIAALALTTTLATQAWSRDPVIAVQASGGLSVTHALGTAMLKKTPKRVVSYDMSLLDSLDQLGIPVVAMPKDYVPHFLEKYKTDKTIRDVGSVLMPNLEALHAVKPDVVLISPLEAGSYGELAEIAPTLYFDFDYMNEKGDYIGGVKHILATLGRVFGVQAAAQQKIAAIDAKVKHAQGITKGRSEKALVVMYIDGAFNAFGTNSRYGFLFDTLGLTSAMEHLKPGMHGEPVSNEFILKANPDILYVIDRTAATDHTKIDRKSVDNPLLRRTNAWKNNRVVFVDPDAWYLSGAGVTSLTIIIDDVLKGYDGKTAGQE